MKLLSLLLLCIAFFASSTVAFVSPLSHGTKAAQATTLFLAKKKAAAKTKKIQVKMLKSVPGTGQKGDVVQVTPPFFNNKLRPTQSAEIISDEEVAGMLQDQQVAKEAERSEANVVKEALEATELKIIKKAGPAGHLFGGIGAKVIMDELHKQIPGHDEFLNRKGVKIVTMTDGDGKKIRQDIKDTGSFGAKIALTKEITGQIKISVEAEP